MNLSELFCSGEAIDSPDHDVVSALSLEAGEVSKVQPWMLRYWDGKDQAAYLAAPVGGVMVVPMDCDLLPKAEEEIIVRSKDPRSSFMLALCRLRPTSFHTRAVVASSSASFGENCAIGGPGFGYFEGQRIPHLGRVVIGDDVEIGSNTCIDRGTLGDTVIGNRTKIDNLVHIAHNVKVGQDCIIVAGSVVGGSAVIGDRVFIGINASIKNKVRIGPDAVIGMGAVVTMDVPAGEVWAGNPAKFIRRNTAAK